MLDALAVGSQLGDVMHVDENLLELASHSTRYFADRTAATWHMHQQTTQRNRMPRAPASRHVFVHTAPRVACNFEIGLLGIPAGIYGVQYLIACNHRHFVAQHARTKIL